MIRVLYFAKISHKLDKVKRNFIWLFSYFTICQEHIYELNKPFFCLSANKATIISIQTVVQKIAFFASLFYPDLFEI